MEVKTSKFTADPKLLTHYRFDIYKYIIPKNISKLIKYAISEIFFLYYFIHFDSINMSTELNKQD